MINLFARVLISLLSRHLLTLLLIVSASVTYAQVTVDISKITCEQFNVLPKADSVAIWLSGYYHGERRSSVVEINKFEDNARDLRAACRQADNFKRTIMQLIEANMPK